MNYKLFGHDVRIIFIWQMILGVLTNLLIYLVARRYFGDFTATLSAIMAVFCGPLIFYELVLLRSSMTVFFGIFVVWLFGVALDKNKYPWWLLFGFVTGMAILLQIYFVFFLFGGILLLARTLRKQYKQLFVYTGCLIAGTIIAMSPAVMRNAIVGAPLLSLNSNGATTFITDNNVTVRSFVGWAAAVRITAEIMGSSDGHLIKAIILTLQTHIIPASYLIQLWGKIHATFSWFEISNNVNFYFFREQSIILSIAFFNFLLLTPLALIGLFLAFNMKIKAAPVLIMIIVQLIPLLGFLVLSRHRVALIPVLIPFAAFTITELAGSWKGGKNIKIIMVLVILTGWSASPNNEDTVTLSKLDYGTIYNMYYLESLKKYSDKLEWREATLLLEDFIDSYEPRSLKNIKPFYICKRMKEAEVYLFFSQIHSLQSQALLQAGDTESATEEEQISSRLKEAGSINP